MLPKSYRLRHRRDFATVYQRGVRRHSPSLTLCARLHTPKSAVAPPSRFGISISQKVSKRAVVRNRIKRQVRAVLRDLLPCIQPGWDVIIVVRPNALQCHYSEFLQQLKQLLTQAEIFYGN